MEKVKKVKHIEVDLEVHTKLKTDAASNGMSLKDYVKFLANK